MNLNQMETFKKNMDRMKTNYGVQHFPPEMTELVWQELREFSPKQITNICDKVLSNCAYPPKVGDFRGWAILLREKIRQFEREEERQCADDFWKGTFHSDEVKEIVGTIKKRLLGQISDEDWKQFQQVLYNARSS